MKEKISSYVFPVFAFYWLALLSKSNSYYTPYLLVGILGFVFFILNAQNPKSISSRLNRVVTELGAILLSVAVCLANYSLFLNHSSRSAIVKSFCSALAILFGGYLLFRQIFIFLYYRTRGTAFPALTTTTHDKWVLLGAWGILSFTNLIILFGAMYPGLLTPDSINQIKQFLTHSYSNHHPYYHTQIIHLFVSIGMRFFGDINAAVAVYSVFSILVMALCFAYVVYTLYQYTRNRFLTAIAFLFYWVMPFHIMYSFTMWKDVFFGAAVTLFIVALFRILKGIGSSTLANYIVMLIAALGMCLLRSNGWTAFVASVFIFAILFRKRQKKLLLMFCGIILLSFFLKRPVLKALGVTQPDTIEALSIPAQQIARVIADGKELTDAETELLSQIIDLEKVPQTYSSGISDPIKGLVRASKNQEYLVEHSSEYLQLYTELGLKYPHKYLEAWIDQTKGYWNAGYSYWRWAGGVQSNDFGIFRTTGSPFLSKCLSLYLGLYEITTLFQLFLCIGLYVWGILYAAYVAFIRRDWPALFVTIPPLMVIFSLLVATPVFAEFRYAYCVFCAIPFILGVSAPFSPRKK